MRNFRQVKDDEEYSICGRCNGSGEGMHESQRCGSCNGSGISIDESDDCDEIDDHGCDDRGMDDEIDYQEFLQGIHDHE